MASPAAIPISEITLSIDDIVGIAVSIKGIRAKMAPGGSAEIAIAELTLLDQRFLQITLNCASLQLQASYIRCPQGRLKAGDFASDVSFKYTTAGKRLELTLSPSQDERWAVNAVFGADRWQAGLQMVNGKLSRLAPLLPKDTVRPTAGTLNGTLALAGSGALVSKVDGKLMLADLAFSDPTGLRAGEKIAGALIINGERAGQDLRWQAELTWDKGELFWSPLYFPSGGQHVLARGSWTGDILRVDDGTLRVAGVGDASFKFDWRHPQGIATLTVDAGDVDAGGLYSLLLKPFLNKTALDQLTASGRAGIGFRYADNEVKEFDLRLTDVGLIDGHKRFAVDKLNARIPWQANAETRASIGLGGATLLSVPIGAFEVPVRMHGYNIDVDEAGVPVLDGKLLIKNLRATRDREVWRWNFSGVLLPVSMEAVSRALEVPRMGGVLAATIPMVTYDKGRVDIQGGIGIRVFDGDIAITELSLNEPLGAAPRLNAEVEMRNLDLGLLTRTFKFGSMEGRIDADVKGLELSNWRPVKFDARVESSPGDYRKKISQQAVQNISSLGGAGAAAAIQRSFLSFFKEFGYQKIGLSCRLRNNICEMGGVESTPQGYVIVKGGGIPAITVLGYNRYVGWNELLERLSRIIDGNAQPIIK